MYIRSNMNYSTLKEAYSIDSFEKKPKKKKIRVEDDDEITYPKTERIEKFEKSETQSEKSINDSETHKQDILKEIEPYYDEEIEKYLNINDFNENISYLKNNTSKESKEIKDLSEDVKNAEYNKYIEPKCIEITRKESHIDTNDTFMKNMINIGLYILVGLLIIFICDQITEIAISIGMKKTVYILEPYLHNI